MNLLEDINCPVAVRKTRIFIMVVWMLFGSTVSTSDGTFYIDANHGNDSWFGTLPDPDNSGNGPFLTFPKALDEIRRQRAIHKYEHVFLLVKAGTYYILDPILLDHRDSGLSITKHLNDQDKPRLVGGPKLNASEFVEWRTINPKLREYRTRYTQKCSAHVFIDSKRLIRARKPNLLDWNGHNFVGQGPYLTIKDLLKSSKGCDRQGSGGWKQETCPDINKWGFEYREADILPYWKSFKNGGEITIFQSWIAERMKVRTATRIRSRVMFHSALRQPIGEYPTGSGWRYIVENTYEVLDSLGEFYCHEKRRFLSVVLPVDYLQGREIFVAENSNFFKVRGASDIHFSGLSFMYSGDRNFYGYNANPAVLQFYRCNNVEIVDCKFQHIGHVAVTMKSSINIEIRLNKFIDIGYKGVILEYEDDPTDLFATRNATIRKNRFNGCGIMNMLQPSCVHVRGVRQINVVSNRISRTAYAGIMVGWQKAFSDDYIKDDFIFRIRRNHIYDYGKQILNDFAGIYLSTNQPDCGSTLNISMCHIHALVEENVVHEGHGFAYGGKGVYTDTAASSVTIRRNWLYNFGDASIVFHCGTNNQATMNMIVHKNSERVFGMCNKSVGKNGLSPTQAATFTLNVIYVVSSQATMWRKHDYWTNQVPRFEKNVYYLNPKYEYQTEMFFPKRKNIEEWRKLTKNDRHSIVADPLFVDLRHDLRLLPNSPALALGIKSIDLRDVIFESIP